MGLILDLATRAGLSAICEPNITSPYVASSNRTASREEDRIYAIQQIFGFQLGSSAVGFSGYSFTLAQLRAQFARKLLAVYPCESQMFLHSKPAPVGTAWLPNGDSRIPFGIPKYRRTSSHIFSGASDKDTTEKQPCTLGIADLDNATWASFTGPTSSWSAFETIFKRTDQDQVHKQLWLTICLDAGDESNMAWQKPSFVFDCLGEELPSSLSSSLAGAQAVVLLLGHYEIPSDSGWNVAQSAAVGLILKPYLVSGTQRCYRRLGFCVWHLRLRSPEGIIVSDDPEYLYSKEKPSSTAQWKVVSGLFG